LRGLARFCHPQSGDPRGNAALNVGRYAKPRPMNAA
jgi:hypothetical protein